MKKKLQNLALYLVLVVVGAISGIIMVVYLDGVFEEYGLLLSLSFKALIFLLTFYVQLILHEVGHLVSGLLSGYSFGSFRIGSIMLVKRDGRLKIKRQSIAGTGGQCLMIPPEPIDGKIPVVFYNLGGVIMNLIALPICVFLVRFLIGKPLPYAVCVFMFLSGLIIALTNGIPLKTGMMNNDGSNACELRRSKEAVRAFYCQFMILDSIRNGTRLKDISDDYFPTPTPDGMKNSISASAAIFLENRLMDAQRFDEAIVLINELLKGENALVGIHKSLLISDKITILLMQGNTALARNLYLSKSYQAFSKQMKTSISVIRTDYAFAILCDKNSQKAGEIMLRFDKYARTHPYISDVESERELIDRINCKADSIS